MPTDSIGIRVDLAGYGPGIQDMGRCEVFYTFQLNMSCSLNSLKQGYIIGEYIWDYYRAY